MKQAPSVAKTHFNPVGNLNQYLEGIQEALLHSVLPSLRDAHATSQLLAVLRILIRLMVNGSPVPAEFAKAAENLERVLPRVGVDSRIAHGAQLRRAESGNALADVPDQYFGGPELHRSAEAMLKAEAIKPDVDAVHCRALLTWEADCFAKLRQKVSSFARADSATIESVPQEAIKERFETYLRQRYPQSPGLKVTEVTVLPGGRSKLTALVGIAACKKLPNKIVLRRDHPSHVTGTTVVTEFPVLAAAHAAGVRVPKPYFVESSREPLGGAFAVVGIVAGRRPCNPLGPLKSPALALSFARQLARLHRIPLVQINPLFSDSRRMTSQTFLAELDAVEKIWSGSNAPPSLAVAYAFTWLRRNVALVDASHVLVHGDASFHNVMASGDRFTALLDWEWAHIGAPAEDLGYCRPAVESAIEWGRFMDAYNRAGGPAVPQEQIDFYSVWGRLRIITMIIAARALYLAGPARDLEFAHTAIDELYTWYETLHIDLERVHA